MVRETTLILVGRNKSKICLNGLGTVTHKLNHEETQPCSAPSYSELGAAHG